MPQTLKLPIYVLLILSLSISSAFAQRYGFQIDDNKNTTTIPFKIYSNLMVVDVIINNILPAKFVVDTGVRSIIITDKDYLDILGVSYGRSLNLIGAAGGEPITAHVTTGASIEIANITGYNQAMLVLEEDFLRLGDNMGVEVQGIIGYDIFTRFVVAIDYENQEMTLYEPQDYKPPSGFVTRKIFVEDTKPYIYTAITMADGSLMLTKMMLDTGASHALMLHQNSNDLLQMPQRHIRSSLGRGLGGDIYGAIGRVGSVTFGGYVLQDPIASFPDPGTYDDVISNTLRNGTIGGDIFKRFHVIFNYNMGELYIKPYKDYNAPFHYDMSGMDIKAVGRQYQYFVVDRVREHSAAYRADIRPNDVIVTFQGNKRRNINLNIITEALRSQPGKKIKLTIRRGKRIIDKEIWLEDLI